MVNWEFFDNQTPASAREVVDRLRAGQPVRPTRGADSVATFRQVERVLAGFSDGRADEGVAAGGPTLAGRRLAAERGWTAPRPEASASPPGPQGEQQRVAAHADQRLRPRGERRARGHHGGQAGG